MTLGRDRHKKSVWVYQFILHPGQLVPQRGGGEAVSGLLAPLGVKIPWPGQLASHPPPPENLTELNAERFYFFFLNKNPYIETLEN